MRHKTPQAREIMTQSTLRPKRATSSSQPHRPGPPPNAFIARRCFWLAVLGFVAIIATVITSESSGTLRSSGGVFTAIARLGGFAGAYLMLLMVVLIARITPLERAVGQDRLTFWHRKIAPWAMLAVTTHVVFITLGYAASAHSGVPAQVWTFVTSYPDVLAAMVGFALLVMASISSIKVARKQMRYETWWIVHLYTYLGLTLAFVHQIQTGVTFVGHPFARIAWTLAWCLATVTVIAYRIGLPLIRSARHQLRVVAVTQDVPGVATIVCSGRKLERLAVSGGQFFRWRFLTRELWWHSHPYSLSALPRPPYLRFTVKALGDQSRLVHSVPLGTRVMIEGPYGAFTQHRRTRKAVAFFAAGVGVTPLRTMLEELPLDIDVVVVMRAMNVSEIVHRDEMAELVKSRGGKLHEIVGSPASVSFNPKFVQHLIPDLERRDVFVCGPAGFMDDVVFASRKLGVPSKRIHREVFAF